MDFPFKTLLDGSDRKWMLAENDFFIAILESVPMQLGHVVIVSKIAEDHLLRLPDAALASLLVFSKPIARAIERVIACEKVGVAVIGLQTRHAHLHLVPIHSADDLNFSREKRFVPESELRATFRELLEILGTPDVESR